VRNEFGPEDVAIEPIRNRPIGDAADAVIKADLSESRCHGFSSSLAKGAAPSCSTGLRMMVSAAVWVEADPADELDELAACDLFDTSSFFLAA
jgi:hypothetical protein